MSRVSRVSRVLFVVLAMTLVATPARAHDLQPGALAVREVAPGAWRVRTTDARDGEAGPVRLRPEWPRGCAQAGTALTCDGPLAGVVQLPGLADRRVKVVVSVERLDGTVEQQVVPEGVDAVRIGGGGVSGFALLGLTHVLGGIDHLLFVGGLALVARRLWPIVGAVTGFTVAHSLTLAASVLGFVGAPGEAVELVIAGSILLVAREALREAPSLAARAPWLVAFGFGLVHGFGFAGALAEIGLPERGRGLALLLFNLGVEGGQLLALGGMAVLARAWQALSPRPEVGRRVAAYALGLPAGLWTVERLAAWLGALGG
jgi:hypothetical protein